MQGGTLEGVEQAMKGKECLQFLGLLLAAHMSCSVLKCAVCALRLQALGCSREKVNWRGQLSLPQVLRPNLS